MPVAATFGASGLLRERIEKGEPADVFASADMGLSPAVKLGTSTPKADPSGDYALEFFAKAEVIRPGARAALEQKALKLTGGPDSPHDYGLIVLKDAPPRATQFARFIVSPDGQAILASHGFAPGDVK